MSNELIINMQGEGEKHTYVEPMSIDATCPKCGHKQQAHLPDYLYFPSVGVEGYFGAECEKCEAEIKVPFTIKKMQIIVELK